jgi:hypothetical protein
MAKNGTVTVQYNEDKLKAINIFIQGKGLSLENELTAALEGLYKKHVPAQAKLFIEADEPKPAQGQ